RPVGRKTGSLGGQREHPASVSSRAAQGWRVAQRRSAKPFGRDQRSGAATAGPVQGGGEVEAGREPPCAQGRNHSSRAGDGGGGARHSGSGASGSRRSTRADHGETQIP